MNTFAPLGNRLDMSLIAMYDLNRLQEAGSNVAVVYFFHQAQIIVADPEVVRVSVWGSI